MPVDLAQARYATSAPALGDCPADSRAEAAFVGRSNAGKSSAINSITGRKGLARISKTPGRTRLFNYFSVGDGLYLVDLPGYGFARVPPKMKEQWEREMRRYLERRAPLAGLMLLADARHPLRESDHALIGRARRCARPVRILLTKSDKLSRRAAGDALRRAERDAGGDPAVSAQLFSSTAPAGVETARQALGEWLDGARDGGSGG